MSSPHTIAEGWLSDFPEPMRDVVKNWFAFAVNNGSRTPAEVVERVTQVVENKLSWSVATESRERCVVTLAALRDDAQSATAYAKSMLATERRVS